MLQNALAAFAQHVERDAETAIGGFRAGNRLEQQIDGRAALQRGELRGDVREAAGLRGNFVDVHQAIQRAQDRA